MNEKTCLLDAAACVITIHYLKNPDYEYEPIYLEAREKLLSEIGHDGSERGYHSQEIQDALRKHDYLMIRHELYPCLQVPDKPGSPKIIPIYPREEVANIFIPKLNRNSGILVCRWRSGVHHALAYQAGSNCAYHVHKDKFIPLEQLDIVMFLEVVP